MGGLVALGAIWWKRATVIYWFKWLGHKCRILKTAPTKPAAGADNLCKLCNGKLIYGDSPPESPFACSDECRFLQTSCQVCIDRNNNNEGCKKCPICEAVRKA